MSLIFRLVGSRNTTHLLNNKLGLISCIRPVTLKATNISPPKEESHDERNMKLGRPQSPHLTIYSFQLTAMLSISHRATGMVLSAYAIAFGLGALVLPESIPHYIDHLESLHIGAGAMSLFKFSLAFPMTYHFWNGIRHLLWDAGKFLSIREVYSTGYIMLALSLSSAIALTFM